MGKQVDKNDFWFIEKNPITKVGVYPYLGKQISQDCEPDKIYYVLRPKEELFRKETLDSLRLIPLIDGHTMIGKDFTAPEEKGLDGTLGDNVSHDTDTIYNDLKIISNKMKEEIQNGKKELSLGYFCRYDKQPGTYKGQRYDYVQRDIIANHLALVDKGRMGADVRVYDSQNIPEGEAFAMDSIDIAIDKDEDIEWITVRGTHVPIKKGENKEQAVRKFLESKKSGESKGIKGSSEKLFHKGEIVTPEQSEAQFKEDDFVKTPAGIGKISQIVRGKLSDTPYYKVTFEDGKTKTFLEEEIEPDNKTESNEKSEPERETKKNTLKSGKFEISVDPNKMQFKVKDTQTGKIKKIDASDNDGLWSYLEENGIEDLPSIEQLNDLTETQLTTKNRSKEAIKIYAANKAFFDDRIKKPQEFKKELNKTFEEIYTDKTGRRYGEKKDRVATFKDIYEEAVKKYLNKDKGTQDSMEYKTIQGEGKMEKEKKVAVADEDKRKLIDEIGGILKDKGLDDEIIRTVIGKAEKIAYNKSEAGDEGEEVEEEVIEEEKDKKPAKDKCGKDEDKKEEKKGMDEGEIFKMLARKEKLAKEVETVIGTFDHSEMTENQVAKYACDKLELGAVEGQELATLKGYLKAVASSPKVTYGYKTVAADGGIQKEDAEFEKFSKGE